MQILKLRGINFNTSSFCNIFIFKQHAVSNNWEINRWKRGGYMILKDKSNSSNLYPNKISILAPWWVDITVTTPSRLVL